MATTVAVLLLSLLQFSTVTGLSSGASPVTCINLTPRGPHGNGTSLDTNPFILDIAGPQCTLIFYPKYFL